MKENIKAFCKNDIFSYSAVITTILTGLLFFLRNYSVSLAAILIIASILAGSFIWVFLHRKGWDSCLIYLAFFTSPAITLILTEYINGGFISLGLYIRVLNYICILVFFMALRLIIPRFYISVTIGNIIMFLWACANHYVEVFRGKPILPWDLTALSTALNVAEGYDFRIDHRIIIAFLIIALWAILLVKLEATSKKIKAKILIPFMIASMIILSIFVFTNKRFHELPTEMWETNISLNYHQKGMVLSFLKYATMMNISIPDDYSPEALELWAENYKRAEKADNNAVQPQTIIMVMNESFADMSVLGSDLSGSYMPFWNRLKQDSISGNLYVSVRGGSTCNTEWETLTGNSLLFLPAGAFPFESYINHDSYSLAHYFKDLGYITEGIHFDWPRNWRRDQVYPYLGFQNFYSIFDFDEKESLRDRVLDSENYEEVIHLYEQNVGEKQFIYNVTIQNHGGYSPTDDFSSMIDLSEYGDYPSAEIYFSLIQISDDALKYLIDYFETVDEPVMIIVYGDHQPELGEAVDAWLSAGKEARPENVLDSYVVPFLIWTNYDSESAYIDKISANYFPSLILKAGHFDLPIFNQYLLDVYEEYPVLSLAGILDCDGNYYSSLDDVEDPDGLLTRYAQIQYNNMFDNKNLVDILYD